MSKTSLLTLAAFATAAAFSGVSKADVANVVYDDDGNRMPLTCQEATQDAWFERQLERSDGDTSPAVPVPAQCTPELVADLAQAPEESK
jgi:hypothetical protein